MLRFGELVNASDVNSSSATPQDSVNSISTRMNVLEKSVKDIQDILSSEPPAQTSESSRPRLIEKQNSTCLPSNATADGTLINSNQVFSSSTIKTIVTNSVRDMERRKKNIIVTGLKESGDLNRDIQDFGNICETNLDHKPRVVYARRLGKEVVTGKSRKLLISLNYPDIASDLLSTAKKLKNIC